MDSIKQYILHSATSYLEFLEKENLGIEEMPIIKYHLYNYNDLLFHFEQNLLTKDYLQLHINDYLIDLDLIEKKEINEKTHTLRIKFNDKELEKIINDIKSKNDMQTKIDIDSIDKKNILQYLINNINSSSNLKIYVDLKFLVKNIQELCSQDFISINLPTKKPLPLKIELQEYINKEQKEAIKGIFSNPISYIWGISGSGKTQVVLFNSLLNIIKQNKKVLILAPTNTALEQILRSLIKQCDKRGITRNKFLRLGMPSNEFLQSFPEVCIGSDDNNMENQIDDENNTLFQQLTLKDRLQSSFIIGLTLDGFVKRYKSLCNLNFSHIFLDECAFSPLIKIIPPLALNIPITFLGDHKQLMPICLMDDILIKNTNHSVCLWNLNALFLEELLHDKENLHHKNNYDDIKFRDIAHYKLTTTHRYGDNLAKVLDKHIYLNGLKGVGLQTEIYYIDSSKFGVSYQYSKTNNRNENHGEAKAIAEIIKTGIVNYAVLTPFRDQQKLLINSGIHRNHVFTIHKSQGQEFDTIIFSPVKFSKHLTDSNNKSALFALNVAVSRLKYTLIIVCDYNQWIIRNNQFITSLLKQAKPYNYKPTTKQTLLPF